MPTWTEVAEWLEAIPLIMADADTTEALAAQARAFEDEPQPEQHGGVT